MIFSSHFFSSENHLFSILGIFLALFSQFHVMLSLLCNLYFMLQNCQIFWDVGVCDDLQFTHDLLTHTINIYIFFSFTMIS